MNEAVQLFQRQMKLKIKYLIYTPSPDWKPNYWWEFLFSFYLHMCLQIGDINEGNAHKEDDFLYQENTRAFVSGWEAVGLGGQFLWAASLEVNAKEATTQPVKHSSSHLCCSSVPSIHTTLLSRELLRVSREPLGNGFIRTEGWEGPLTQKPLGSTDCRG